MTTKFILNVLRSVCKGTLCVIGKRLWTNTINDQLHPRKGENRIVFLECKRPHPLPVVFVLFYKILAEAVSPQLVQENWAFASFLHVLVTSPLQDQLPSKITLISDFKAYFSF
jgi:hypothetical protein